MLTHIVVAKILLRANDNSFLTIRRSQTDPRRPLQWDLPGGQVEEAENYATAVSREVKEETDLDVSADNVELIYTKTAMRPEGSVVYLFYIGDAPSKTVVVSHEHGSYKWISLAEMESTIEHPAHKELLRYVQDNFAKQLKA